MKPTKLELAHELSAVKNAKRQGWKVYKVAFLGINGAPDRLFGKGKRGVFIEFKREGEEPTKQQFIRHAELREECGFEVEWTDSYEGACAILGIMP